MLSWGISAGAILMSGPQLQPMKRHPLLSNSKFSYPNTLRNVLHPLSDHFASWLPATT